MERSTFYIEVAAAVSVYNTYTYSVPENMISLVVPGMRVLVPFGKRRITGYVLGNCDQKQMSSVKKILDVKRIKKVLDVLDDEPLFPESMVPFFRWIADYYMHPIGEVIMCALPGGMNHYDISILTITRKGELVIRGRHGNPLEKGILDVVEKKPGPIKDIRRVMKEDIPDALIHRMIKKGWLVKEKIFKSGRTGPMMIKYAALTESVKISDPTDVKLTDKRRKIIDLLRDVDGYSLKELKESANTSYSVIKSLSDAGCISITSKKVYRDPFGETVEPDKPLVLTIDQKKVFSHVTDMLGKGFNTFLLAGVTGSGKTEVYLQLSAEVIKRGKPVLILVPEIALISQIERSFRARFGKRVAVLHSGLSAGERYDQWKRIMRKEAVIAIGARSAIFAPFSNTGIIIVDEEHDPSYKQDGRLRYNARDLAVVRAKFDNGVALLGSATPSVQSYYNAVSNKFIELNLNKRVEERPLPEISIVDLRRTRDLRGIRRFISEELSEAMRVTLENKKQVLLFLNRRGFAGFPVCGTCGESLKCKNCDITLTLHKGINAYKCHYCGYMRPSVSGCKVCGSSSIKNLGMGTEKIEAAVKALFPEARTARMDRDTTVRKGSMIRILKSLKNNEIDILIGTQMVAKGHDFPNITLVGIVCADFSLNFPDFRAGERTFQLLAQVSGRAGRGDVPGRVILQTYNPNHFSILSAKDQDFRVFYNREIGFRKALKYPPFSRIIQLKISGPDKGRTANSARKLGELCRSLLNEKEDFVKTIEILGPIEASILRVANMFRWQILLKGLNVKSIQNYIHRLVLENPSFFKSREIKVAVDVDPFFMM